MKITNMLLFLILLAIISHCYISYNNTDNNARRWVTKNCKNLKKASHMNLEGVMKNSKSFKTLEEKVLCQTFFMSKPEYFVDK